MKQVLVKGIDKFSSLIRLDVLRDTMTAKHRIQEIGYSCGFFGRQWCSFYPLRVIISTCDDVPVKIVDLVMLVSI